MSLNSCGVNLLGSCSEHGAECFICKTSLIMTTSLRGVPVPILQMRKLHGEFLSILEIIPHPFRVFSFSLTAASCPRGWIYVIHLTSPLSTGCFHLLLPRSGIVDTLVPSSVCAQEGGFPKSRIPGPNVACSWRFFISVL